VCKARLLNLVESVNGGAAIAGKEQLKGARRGTSRIVFARVRNALKRRVVASFLKELVCVKSSEVTEKKPVVGSGFAFVLPHENRSRHGRVRKLKEILGLFPVE